MMRVLIPIGCRSDAGLVAPIIRRLKQDPAFEVMQYDLKPMDFIESYRITVDKINEFHPSLFFANADRVEMTGATNAAFMNKVKIAHYQAGVINDPITTYDDILRHNITLLSDIQFCENLDAHSITKGIINATGRLANAHLVGITHLDDLQVDESKVPDEQYDLVLYNYPPLQDPRPDIYSIEEMVADKGNYIILVGGNPDAGTMFDPRLNADIHYTNLSRPQFMGLMKNCQRFITNSSCAITEAPYFLKPEQIVMVGDRNRNRPPVECKPGGSDKIVAILKEYANAYTK
jgi:UDP-N-acetylglucosamine 2-epimerase